MFCDFFLLGTTLSFDFSHLCRNQLGYVLIMFYHRSYSVGLELLRKLNFSLSKIDILTKYTQLNLSHVPIIDIDTIQAVK
jgi:hypothetical protein